MLRLNWFLDHGVIKMSCQLGVSGRLAEYRMVGEALLEGGLVRYWLVREAFGARVLKARLDRLMSLSLAGRDHLLGCAGLFSTARHAIPWVYIECYTYLNQTLSFRGGGTKEHADSLPWSPEGAGGKKEMLCAQMTLDSTK